MSVLDDHLSDYLAVRRALGYRLVRHDKLLGQFLDELAARGVETITTADALAWATRSPRGPHSHPKRLQALRGFARYLRSIGVPVEVPPSDLLPERRRRAIPYLYSDEEIAALLAAASKLPTPHRVATYQTLIGLLAVTGIRRGEAIALDRSDFDKRAGVITIRAGKFGKTRELPLHVSTVAALTAHLKRPDRPDCETADGPALLIRDDGRRLSEHTVNHTFHRLAEQAGLKPRSPECRPRLHDLRHSFAVRTLLDAHRGDEPLGPTLGPTLVALSTYMGHTGPSHTYWYLEAAPELMALATERLDREIGGEQ